MKIPRVSIVSKLLTKTPYVNIFLAVIVKATVNYGSNPSGTLATTIPIKYTQRIIL
jgi:hypothetical protein